MRNHVRLVLGLASAVACVLAGSPRREPAQPALLTPETTLETNTFSIVIADQRSREVAVAGASCVQDASIIASLIRNVGAAATQASFSSTNKTRVEDRLRAGASPQAVIAFVTNPGRDANFRRRQYGVVTLANGAAGFTGSQTSNARGDRQGPFVSVQGNLLVSTAVLDGVLNRYLQSTQPPLVQRLLLALEAGQAAGGDARCEHGADSAFIRIRRAESATLYANLVVTNPSSGHNPNDPIAQLRGAVAAWANARAGQVDRWTSTARVAPARIPADGTPATLTVTLRNPGGSGLVGRVLDVQGSASGEVSAFMERGGGVYTATVRSTTAGTETFTIRADGVTLGDRPSVTYTAP
jgi:uncharacterized Ntn-hydrolase superfamily protein